MIKESVYVYKNHAFTVKETTTLIDKGKTPEIECDITLPSNYPKTQFSEKTNIIAKLRIQIFTWSNLCKIKKGCDEVFFDWAENKAFEYKDLLTEEEKDLFKNFIMNYMKFYVQKLFEEKTVSNEALVSLNIGFLENEETGMYESNEKLENYYKSHGFKDTNEYHQDWVYMNCTVDKFLNV